MWLYNPDLESVGRWEISSLQCVNHDDQCDGLHAVYEEGHDTHHAVLVPVPVSMMDYAGMYISSYTPKMTTPSDTVTMSRAGRWS